MGFNMVLEEPISPLPGRSYPSGDSTKITREAKQKTDDSSGEQCIMAPRIDKPKPGEIEKSIVRSSIAKYLTFVAPSGEGTLNRFVQMKIFGLRKNDGLLNDVETYIINYHLKKCVFQL